MIISKLIYWLRAKTVKASKLRYPRLQMIWDGKGGFNTVQQFGKDYGKKLIFFNYSDLSSRCRQELDKNFQPPAIIHPLNQAGNDDGVEIGGFKIATGYVKIEPTISQEECKIMEASQSDSLLDSLKYIFNIFKKIFKHKKQ